MVETLAIKGIRYPTVFPVPAWEDTTRSLPKRRDVDVSKRGKVNQRSKAKRSRTQQDTRKKLHLQRVGGLEAHSSEVAKQRGKKSALSKLPDGAGRISARDRKGSASTKIMHFFRWKGLHLGRDAVGVEVAGGVSCELPPEVLCLAFH